MRAYAVLGDASPLFVYDAEVDCASRLRCSAAIRYYFLASP
jgi:hypothetical protein